MRILIVGKGVVGRALCDMWGEKSEVTFVAARSPLIDGARLGELIDTGAYDLVVHAAGPAGEAACLADPLGAFRSHYSLAVDLAMALVDFDLDEPTVSESTREHAARLALIGTLAPEGGYYPSLKRAAALSVRAAVSFAHERGRGAALDGEVTVAECGQIVGPGIPVGRGVIGVFLQDALAGRQLTVDGAGEQTVRATDVRVLARTLLESYGPYAPVTDAWSVRSIAEECASAAERLGRKRPDIVLRSVPIGAGELRSYEPPSRGAPVVRCDMAALLRDWAEWAERQHDTEDGW